jgi:hypothetical protein
MMHLPAHEEDTRNSFAKSGAQRAHEQVQQRWGRLRIDHNGSHANKIVRLMAKCSRVGVKPVRRGPPKLNIRHCARILSLFSPGTLTACSLYPAAAQLRSKAEPRKSWQVGDCAYTARNPVASRTSLKEEERMRLCGARSRNPPNKELIHAYPQSGNEGQLRARRAQDHTMRTNAKAQRTAARNSSLSSAPKTLTNPSRGSRHKVRGRGNVSSQI